MVTDYDRQSELANQRTRGQEALAAKRFGDALAAFTAAILLSAASTHQMAFDVSRNASWRLDDPQRLEAAALYAGRADASAKLKSWASALADAHAASLLDPVPASLERLAKAAAGTAGLEHAKPASGLRDLPVAVGRASTKKLCHGLVADVYAMLAEDHAATGAKGRRSSAKFLRRREYHAQHAGGLFHPRARRKLLTEEQGREAIAFAVEAALPDLASTPPTPHAMLLEAVLNLTAFRLGLRNESLLEWRPFHLSADLRDDRVVEVWLAHRLRNRGESGQLLPGQRVRIVSPKGERAKLDGKLGEVVSYAPERKRPYLVRPDEPLEEGGSRVRYWHRLSELRILSTLEPSLQHYNDMIASGAA